MATLHYSKRLRGRIRGPHVPYIIADDGNYLEGPNYYLEPRCTGRLRLNAGNTNEVAIKRLPRSTIHAIGHRLTNFATWMETPDAHPELGAISWDEVEEWHVTELYRDAMVAGYWTQEFWATGNPTPLKFGSTIKQRINEVASCYEWQRAEGIYDWKAKERPPLSYIQRCGASAINGYLRAAPEKRADQDEVVRYRRRLDPGNWSPLTPLQIRCLLKHIPEPEYRLPATTYLTTGIRLDELVNNTLLPGEYHLRSEDERALWSPRFPRGPYRMLYDPEDDRMIGVLPDADTAFAEGCPLVLQYRILGKGTKIRTVWLPASLVRLFWRYYVSFRARRLKLRNKAASPFMFLNRLGNPITPKNISSAIMRARRAAERELGVQIPVTPHVFRHTFACFFIESSIATNAEAEGLNPKTLALDDIERLASQAAIILQPILGHALLDQTLRYARQLAHGKVGLQYLEAFTVAMGEVLA